MRAPRPGEQDWLRLILLVRRIQHGQVALVRRLDEMHAITGVAGTIRSDFQALHEQLGAARVSAAELERVLAERLEKVQPEADATAGNEDVDRRIGALDSVLARLETLAGQAQPERMHAHELEALLARFGELAQRLEAEHESERALGGQEELAKLYERIQELAEGLAPARLEPGEAAHVPRIPGDELDEHIARLGEQLELLEDNVRTLGESGPVALEERLERLERVAARLERRARPPFGGGTDPDALLGRFAELAERLERSPAALPELPPETITSADGTPPSARELEELRAMLLAEREARRQSEEEVRLARDKLRSSELARVELETRHASELTQMADHVQRQLARVEDDLKKKKRGMAELTQQNITLQNQLARLLGKPASEEQPPAPLPRGGGGGGARAQLLEPGQEPQAAPDAGKAE